jgi:hypothetical protein
MAAKRCQRCGKKPVRKGYRFCNYCIAALRREMKAAHYLTLRPRTHHLNDEESFRDALDNILEDDGDDLALALLHAWLGC